MQSVSQPTTQRPNPSRRYTCSTEDSLVYQIGNNLYINLTDRCTLTCTFCPKHNGCTEVKGHQLYLSKRPDVATIIELIGDPSRYDAIVFCGYGEPTLRLKAVLEIAAYVKAHNGKTRLNTDGLGSLFHKRDIVPELAKSIDALSISLNTDTEQLYLEHCQPALPGSYQAMLDFIERAAELIGDVQVSAIDGLKGVNIDRCRALVEARGAVFKHRVLDEVG